MALDVEAVQRVLRAEGPDAWLLYDFHGSNPIAAKLAGLAGGPHMTTRRWFYLIPATGEPRALVHAIERHTLDALPGRTSVYARRGELERGLTQLLEGITRVAMEYSPDCAIPYLSRLDAGTADAIRRRGVEIVSSGDLVQQFEAVWDEAQIASHHAAAAALHRIKDRAFAEVWSAIQTGRTLTEYTVQQQMSGWFREEGLVTDSPPVVAAGAHAGNPHYMPSAGDSTAIGTDQVLLLDLWGKQSAPGAVFADITWVGFTGRDVPADPAEAFSAVVRARDAAVSAVDEATRAGRELRGWEVDRTAREVLESAGFGPYVLHRTGHSLGEQVHGNGVHLDDFETHDDRRILPGTGFTVEPGLYFDAFGVRTEINVICRAGGVVVTGPRQMEIIALGR